MERWFVRKYVVEKKFSCQQQRAWLVGIEHVHNRYKKQKYKCRLDKVSWVNLRLINHYNHLQHWYYIVNLRQWYLICTVRVSRWVLVTDILSPLLRMNIYDHVYIIYTQVRFMYTHNEWTTNKRWVSWRHDGFLLNALMILLLARM